MDLEQITTENTVHRTAQEKPAVNTEPATDQPAHIRKPLPKLTRNQSYFAYRRMKNEELRADYRAKGTATYCGEAATSRDWDRRNALAKKHADAAERECCAACLEAARQEEQARKSGGMG
ncbi:hypothetical protein [Arthrobacter bambusae]|uniref:Uncharacterized protein n=1 Tax=Arthrobacter bambusae TaxID=1338426 RepID=A0AAW8DB74_9MICC|nr:hypothetical protein [Arthrobacter bambusae]MDP9903132.1 hypothetical protein [Arthrobacter bambusae]MDQ0128874.1 hypothetical protein [Arthrobacter bambusae]MDQ0180215.1 hypothetical protein [Arthrobacter bambusae]